MSGPIYTVFFLLLVLYLPYEPFKGHDAIGYTACAIHALILGVVYFRIRSDRSNFFGGLSDVATSSMSGCANLTLIYIFPVLLYYYLCALCYTVIGFFKGKSYTEEKWDELIERRFRLR